MAEGCAGTEGVVLTASDCDDPFPQELEGTTETFPDTVPDVTVILFVPWPAVIDHPEGNVQV
jgi:hypothetical protein